MLLLYAFSFVFHNFLQIDPNGFLRKIKWPVELMDTLGRCGNISSTILCHVLFDLDI
ncbi:hypothetical protein BDV36DRAFT_249216 [Aspergillus pseudocaelatus]|uniref:Uncharacterized protein n=1 Tax=Aspergillus pseudocaelatus TaxID=1825620 RepID=A0ABQ6WU18_9EURO|nr:hypothetical protein BDV36DRAFT_249216 [Aspergillus pseudocaelatus]